MEWSNEIEELYETITSPVPEAFRESVKPMLREAAEKTARLRNSRFVSREDLLASLFEITPPAFQPTVVEDLKKLGIDTERYVKLSEIRKEFTREYVTSSP